jgi:hypothetical protein
MNEFCSLAASDSFGSASLIFTHRVVFFPGFGNIYMWLDEI